MLTSEFASLEEPMEVAEIAAAAGLLANGPEKIGSERQRVPKDPMRKLKLPIFRSMSRSRLLKIETRVGGCGQTSTEPKEIRLSSTAELLRDADVIESMNPTPRHRGVMIFTTLKSATSSSSSTLVQKRNPRVRSTRICHRVSVNRYNITTQIDLGQFKVP
jgi:hypothetical protein